MNSKHLGRSKLKESGPDFHVEGKSLLVVGSSLGHFCLEALKYGAASVTGIDVSFEKVKEARELAKRESSSANFIHADFDDWQGERNSFDIVVCAKTLHHLYDPLGALRKMMRIAREKIILEITDPTWREILRSKHSLRMIGSAASPVILLRPRGQVESTADQTFLFSKGALSGIFNHHSMAFEPILFRRSYVSGRLIVEARRRQIDHLIVIAGVACVGKSRFIDRLTTSIELRTRFGIPLGDFEYVSAHRADQLPSGRLNTVVFHYDILRPFGRALISHQRDPAFHLLQGARE